MPPEVKSSDFSDEDFDRFFNRVTALKASVVGNPPQWIRREAEAFAKRNPRPDYDELRQHIDHSVAVARGWDHPWDRHEMFSMAVKSYYLLAWLNHLQQAVLNDYPERARLDLSYAYKMSFTPMFDGEPQVPA